MKEIQGHTVIPPRESHQMLVGFFTAQTYRLTAVGYFPGQWIVMVNIMFAAVSIAFDTEFYAEVGVSRLCSCHCFFEQMPVHVIPHLQDDAHCHRVFVISPVQVETLNI